MTPARLRHPLVLLTVLSVVSVGMLAASPGVARTNPDTLVVIGDSITAGKSGGLPYNNTVGSARRGWWSYLGAKLGLRPIVYAESGSGYGREGKKSDGSGQCLGSTFDTHLRRDARERQVRAARVVIVEGGINDYRKCVYNPDTGRWNGVVPRTAEELRPIVHSTMRRLAGMRTKPGSVYVTVPWARNYKEHREWIVAIVKSEAESYGFEYVDTAHGTLQYKSQTYDGTHPNKTGNIQLYRDLFRKSDISRWAPR